MNEDERFGRHAERPKDWDEVEAHSGEISPEDLKQQARPATASVLGTEFAEPQATNTVSLPTKSVQALLQNRFFVVAIALLIALVVMLFVLL